MSCSPLDLKDYFLSELGDAERDRVRAHLAVCRECREELERLRLTQAMLLTLRDEDIPRRIAFVSNRPVEQPWWQRFWQAGPRLAFASAAMLSLAILAHAWLQPNASAPPVDTAALEQRISSEVARRLQPAIGQALAESEARQARRFETALAKAREEIDFQRRADLMAVQETFGVFQKRMNVRYVASMDAGGLQ